MAKNSKGKNGKKVRATVVILAVILVVGVIAVASIYGNKVPVNSALVDTGRVERLIEESGTVQSDNTIIVMADRSGEIQEVHGSVGDKVNVGTLLSTGKAMAGAQSQTQSMNSELKALQIQYNQAKESAEKNRALYEFGALSYEEYNRSVIAAEQLAAQISALQHGINSHRESTSVTGAKSPITGVITEVYVHKGQVVQGGAPLFEISDLENIYVEVDLMAEDAELIQEGDLVRVSNHEMGFLDENARVRKIHPKAKDKVSELGISQKRVTVEVALSADEAVRIGSSLDVEIILDHKEDVVRVDKHSLFEMDERFYVYVIQEGKAHLRQVEKGLEGKDFTEIKSGLSKGEKIIKTPSNEVEDGVRVQEQ
ncbi:MAG: efflux RND transporter periplasmic adaptor subunit [Anaerovoracaceae bacterium]|jgi:HlyD family secretion protein